MKKSFILIVSCLFAGIIDAQTEKPLVEYKGGQEQLVGVVFKWLSRHNGIFAVGSPTQDLDSIRKISRYYTGFIQIDKNGIIVGDVLVSAAGDTANMHLIASALRATNGNWINHSGNEIWVIQPISFEYDDGSSMPVNKLITGANTYRADGSKTTIMMPNMPIKLGPVMH